MKQKHISEKKKYYYNNRNRIEREYRLIDRLLHIPSVISEHLDPTTPSIRTRREDPAWRYPFSFPLPFLSPPNHHLHSVCSPSNPRKSHRRSSSLQAEGGSLFVGNWNGIWEGSGVGVFYLYREGGMVWNIWNVNGRN